MTGNGLSRTNKIRGYATYASFPTAGQTGVWYMDLDSGTPYIWDGTAYQDIDPIADDIWVRNGTSIEQVNDGDDVTLNNAGGNPVFIMDVSESTLQVGATDVGGVVESKDASNVVQERLNPVGANYSKGLSQQIGTGSSGSIDYSMADDGFLDIPSGKKGWYKIVVGDNEEDATFNFATDGTVSLLDTSANVVATDTDTKFCIFDNGTNVRIRNRLGSTKVIQINGYYS